MSLGHQTRGLLTSSCIRTNIAWHRYHRHLHRYTTPYLHPYHIIPPVPVLVPAPAATTATDDGDGGDDGHSAGVASCQVLVAYGYRAYCWLLSDSTCGRYLCYYWQPSPRHQYTSSVAPSMSTSSHDNDNGISHGVGVVSSSSSSSTPSLLSSSAKRRVSKRQLDDARAHSTRAPTSATTVINGAKNNNNKKKEKKKNQYNDRNGEATNEKDEAAAESQEMHSTDANNHNNEWHQCRSLPRYAGLLVGGDIAMDGIGILLIPNRATVPIDLFDHNSGFVAYDPVTDRYRSLCQWRDGNGDGAML